MASCHLVEGLIKGFAGCSELSDVAEGRDSQQNQGCLVAIGYLPVHFYHGYSGLDVIQHKSVILLLLHNLLPFLVEDIAQTVESLVESPAEYPFLIKPEVEFLVFQGIQHISHLAPCLSRSDQGGDDSC